jgi:AcrR family transcriptional regulator
MSIADRKVKEKEDLKARILAEAKNLFLEKGIEQTTIRNIADAVNYSVGTVYVYYKDKNTILHELHQQGFAQLGGDMQVLLHVQNPMERLLAMGRIYLNFAIKNPEMYDLMFNMKAPIEFIKECEAIDCWNEGRNTFDFLRQTIAECIQAGHFSNHQPEHLAFVIWGCVHGMCSLVIRERTGGIGLAQPETILTDAYQQFQMMLQRS